MRRKAKSPEMNLRFQDKVVIVTGASSGIGLETALAFAREGARVVLAARTQIKLQAVVDAHPDLRERLHIIPADVTKEEDVRRLIATTITQLGRIDILINNAGIGMRASVAETPVDDARQLMEVNFSGPLRCIQAVLPQMRQQKSGQIVNIGSVLSAVVATRNGVYSASKFALLALTDTLRIELHGTGIEVISVLPAYTPPGSGGRELLIEQGRSFGIVGESGSGKSTLARIALALISRTPARCAFKGARCSI